MWIVKWIVGALLIIVILGFALQNQSQTVSVQIIKWQSPVMPLYIFLYLSYIGGILTWLLFSTFRILKFKGENYQLQRELKKAKDEINRLRNINIEEEVEKEPEAPETPTSNT